MRRKGAEEARKPAAELLEVAEKGRSTIITVTADRFAAARRMEPLEFGDLQEEALVLVVSPPRSLQTIS